MKKALTIFLLSVFFLTPLLSQERVRIKKKEFYTTDIEFKDAWKNFKKGHHFFKQWSAGHQSNNGKIFFNESNRPMFHLSRRIALRVDVRDFLELERAFQCNRIVDAAANI